jgi:acetylglutamate kinase
MEKLYIIKIGGNVVDDESALAQFLHNFASIQANKILVHGGGKLATRIAEAMGIQQQLVEGRRITDAETLKIVTMVYAGYINKNIVAQLQQHQCNAIGLSGADGNAIIAHKRNKTDALGKAVDFGFVGDVDAVNANFIHQLIAQGNTPVMAPITHNGAGQLLNTNADTIAQETAVAMAKLYETVLIYSFEKSGVLLDTNEEDSVIKALTPAYYATLKEQEVIYAGMIPKLDNAFAAINKGVSKVIIGKAAQLNLLIQQQSGTTISNG